MRWIFVEASNLLWYFLHVPLFTLLNSVPDGKLVQIQSKSFYFFENLFYKNPIFKLPDLFGITDTFITRFMNCLNLAVVALHNYLFFFALSAFYHFIIYNWSEKSRAQYGTVKFLQLLRHFVLAIFSSFSPKIRK